MAAAELVTLAELPDQNDLRRIGVFSRETFRRELGNAPAWLVEGLIAAPSVNLLVGDSNLGKTPLALSLGVAVASGTAFLGHRVQQGSVLYCDAESGKSQLNQMITDLSRSAGLSDWPDELHLWSPHWDQTIDRDVDDRLLQVVETVRPRLVFVDPIRAFWPKADATSDRTAETIMKLRQSGVSWVLTHHRRKSRGDGYQPSLVEDNAQWFEDASGSRALVNLTDTRLGVEAIDKGHAELVLAGFLRGVGPLPPMYLAREYEAGGRPLGYRLATGTAFLNSKDLEVYEALPERFRHTDVKRGLGNSDSNARRLINLLVSLDLARPDTNGGRSGYVKPAQDPGVNGESRITTTTIH